MKLARITVLIALATLAGCTYGAPTASTSGVVSAVVVDVNLTLHPDGYNPPTLTVPVGTMIQFTNSDSFAHTATAISGTSFPSASPFDVSAETSSGSAFSAAWSSGILPAGGSSQVFVADRPGTYLYGCFFHYAHPMRGMIVVQ